MTKKPMVAIVGRPNVGKSTFFNRIIGRQISIVEDTPGVTRDRIYADTEWLGRKFTLVDTGGIEIKSEDHIKSQMRVQAQLAAETADLVLFFVDGREGLTGEDMDVADYLRKIHKPVLLVANKVDNARREDAMYEFFELGIGEPIPVSSVHGLGTGDLLDAVIARIGEADDDSDGEGTVRIAVVGKPNAGKSSLVNRILGEDRTIVSEVPGTTRDAIDTPFVHEGRPYVVIDTAGMRRKSRVDHESLERYSVIRALSAVRRCDVALLMVDADTGVSEQDAKIAGYIQDSGKPAVILVNKWDLVDKDESSVGKYVNDLNTQIVFMRYAPILFVSVKTGQRLHKLMEQVDLVYANSRRRIATGLLNDVIGDAVTAVEPPSTGGRRARIYYSTQTGICPPEFTLFTNSAELITDSYKRYLENHLRKTFDFTGTPLKLICKSRQEKQQ